MANKTETKTETKRGGDLIHMSGEERKAAMAQAQAKKAIAMRNKLAELASKPSSGFSKRAAYAALLQLAGNMRIYAQSLKIKAKLARYENHSDTQWQDNLAAVAEDLQGMIDSLPK